MAEKIHQHLFLFSFISLFFTLQATLNLHPSDHNALTTLQNNLGVNVNGNCNGNGNAATNQPCNADGVFCERRLSKNETYVLRITKLTFNSKNLKGKLSPLIGKLTELRELSLSHNKIVDRIPTSIVDCRKLEILNLSNNLFSGEIPSEFSSLIRLRVLDISSNNLAGNLNFLRYFPNLETLSIANNLFTGKIPSSVRSFRNLRHFNFTGNRFLESSVSLNQKQLEIQNTDTTLNLNHKRHILVENHAPASAPSSHRKKSSNSSVSASASAPGPSVHGHKHKKSKRKLIGWIVGFIAGAFAGTLSGFVFSLLFKLILALIKGKGKGSGPAIYSPLIKKAEDLAFLEKEDGLASMEIIGRGGCGEVYKAELPGSNGKMIAIKKIIQPSKDAVELAEEDSKLLHKKMRQIKSEINTVGQIRHRNLLPLLAHLSRPDCHYLVYEFMKNGSLQDMLHRVEKGEAELDWLTRHKIAVGVAAGLEYLHMHHSPRIIHRDLKPANILLDDDMEARIADFGLAKAMPEAQTHVTTSNVAGTVGYIAPEYHQILKFTDKCDIYSFGVMLGVLVIGKQPSDDFFQHTEEMSLVKWMKNVITSETPKIAIDSRLMGNGYEEQMLLVLKIACFCTMDDPKERPNSKDVRCMLSQIKHTE